MMALPDITSDQSVRRAARPRPSRPEGAEGGQANDLSAVRRVPNQTASRDAALASSATLSLRGGEARGKGGLRVHAPAVATCSPGHQPLLWPEGLAHALAHLAALCMAPFPLATTGTRRDGDSGQAGAKRHREARRASDSSAAAAPSGSHSSHPPSSLTAKVRCPQTPPVPLSANPNRAPSTDHIDQACTVAALRWSPR
jgi:hypothetical protein